MKMTGNIIKKLLYSKILILLILVVSACESPFDEINDGNKDYLSTSGINLEVDTNKYKSLMKLYYGDTIIVGTFYDWRPVSKYRFIAGFHYGYDFAAPEGTKVPAGWKGKVTAINYWGYGEYAVQITGKTEEGKTRMTQYGHLNSLEVRIKDKVEEGEIIGRIAVDHVDVKMKINGKYYDFGE